MDPGNGRPSREAVALDARRKGARTAEAAGWLEPFAPDRLDSGPICGPTSPEYERVIEKE
jgi:hypothetical protein